MAETDYFQQVEWVERSFVAWRPLDQTRHGGFAGGSALNGTERCAKQKPRML